MSTINSKLSLAHAFNLFKEIKSRSDKTRWEKAVDDFSSGSLEVFRQFPTFKVMDGSKAAGASLFDEKRFGCSCTDFKKKQAEGAACRHLIAATLSFLPLALQGAREAADADWISVLEALEQRISEVKAQAAEQAEREAIEAESARAPEGGPEPQAPVTPPATAPESLAAPVSNRGGQPSAEEAAASGAQGPPPASGMAGVERNGDVPRLSIKRSMSPDGHIDSVSLLISFPVTKRPMEELEKSAVKILQLQDRITRKYLQLYLEERTREVTPGSRATTPGPSAPGRSSNPVNPDTPVQATLIGIGESKNGRLFATFELAGRKKARFFGNKQKPITKELAPLGIKASEIYAGAEFKTACRVLAKQNGEYLDIERVFPLGQ